MQRYVAARLAVCLVLALGALCQNARAENWLKQNDRISRTRFEHVQRASQLQDDPFADEPVQPPPREMQQGEVVEAVDENFPLDEWVEMNGCPMRLLGTGKLFGGAEYLLARPRFSQGVAFLQVEDLGGDTTETVVEFPFRHESAMRAFIGYQFTDCDSALLFTYSNLTGNASVTSAVTPGTLNPFFVGQQSTATGAGETMTSTAL